MEIIGHYKFILIENNKNKLSFLVKGNTNTLMKVELDKETNFIQPLIIDNERNYTPKKLPLEVLKGICQFCEETKEA